ncbi:MAG: DUF3572 domain-containing protein [Methyloligellaceae bacterium]
MTERHPKISPGAAEEIAIGAFSFLAADDERMSRFFNITGFDPADIAATAREPSFLPGVLEYLLSDESLLLTYCANANLDAAWVSAAHRALLGGGSQPDPADSGAE